MNFPKGLKRTAAMVVLRNGNRLLLLLRAKAPNQHKYVPVGGKLEPFETPIAAARRETLEETGIQVDVLRYCGVLIETSPTEYNWQCNIYLADIENQPPPPCDEGILEWIAFEDIPNIPTPPTDLMIYQYILEGRPFALDAVYDADLNLLEMMENISGERLF